MRRILLPLVTYEMNENDHVVKPFIAILEESKHVMPSPSSVSRWRTIIDGAMMIVERDLIADAYSRGERFARYFMADSSTQHRKEFQHVVIRSIRLAVIARLAALADELVGLWTCSVSLVRLCGPQFYEFYNEKKYECIYEYVNIYY
jgi:hypothetical protein